MRIAAILLASGLSRRFGADKIEALLDGIPLGLHAARTLAGLPLSERFVICRGRTLAWPGFGIIVNDRPEAGMARSIGLGVRAARAARADALLIALADMPYVPAAHFCALLDQASGPQTRLASACQGIVSPPALFGSDWFDRLETLGGDVGGKILLEGARCVDALPHQLIDIDVPMQMERGPKTEAT